MPIAERFSPSRAHEALGRDFFDRVEAAPFPEHRLRFRNQRWAERVGLGALTEAEWITHFGRFEPLPGSLETPLALRYHGHQFRVYNPDLGDGRGFLFAQMRDLGDGRLLDLGTKGSGRTPWSRGADGRLTLKGGVREILATEMLEALGVDTSKSFSLIETGEALTRGDEPSPTRAAVLVRLSHSHIRIGSFQRFAFLKQPDRVEQLLDHTIRTYMPDLWRDALEERTVAFLEQVTRNVARLGAQWTAAGFVHGVLNTDNINVTGESFDYGPWRFLPTYDPRFTAAYFDELGLYAFGRQADALAWNLIRLAGCLLDLAGKEALERAINVFWHAFEAELARALLLRFGLASAGEAADKAILPVFFTFMTESQAPYEQVFFDWYGGSLSGARAERSPAREHYAKPSFLPVLQAMDKFEPQPGLDLHHPYFARERPRTMLIDEVEALWAPIAERDDWSLFETAVAEIREMGDAYGRGVGALPD
jgi:uncharacterized protein YdiU (UPF0061 family)